MPPQEVSSQRWCLSPTVWAGCTEPPSVSASEEVLGGPPYGEDRAAEWRMRVVEDSVTCLFLKMEDTASWRRCFLKTLLPKCCICAWPPASMFVHWLDLNVRFPTVQGKQWGGAELRAPDMHCYLQQASAVPTAGRAPCIPLTRPALTKS